MGLDGIELGGGCLGWKRVVRLVETTWMEMVWASLRKPVDDEFVDWERVNVFGGWFVCWRQRVDGKVGDGVEVGSWSF